MKFSTQGFFSKCDRIRRKLRIWSHLLKKSLIGTSLFVQWLQWPPIIKKSKSRIISLTKNYCIFSFMQKVSSIYKCILEIQQILDFHVLKGHIHFWTCSPKIIKVFFSLREFVSAWKKSVYVRFWDLRLLYSYHFWESCDQNGHTHFWLCSPKSFPTNF